MQEIKRFKSEYGSPIYQIPVEAFPGLWAHAYLVIHGDYRILIDAGSSFSKSSDQLFSGIREVPSNNGKDTLSLSDITHVLITHGHLDHYGGLLALRSQSEVKIGVHELDRGNLTNFLERREKDLGNLENYLLEAGVSETGRENMLQFYRFLSDLFTSIEVDFTYEAQKMQLGPFRFLHVPGHSGGHVVIKFEDILFCGDHILSSITPHQAPERLNHRGGLDRYLRSLAAVDQWSKGINLALCGHQQVITDISARIAEIKEMHMERLEQILDFFKTPDTISALSMELFGEVNGFNILLAIEEAGAHVEYLFQQGLLTIINYDQIEESKKPIVHYYQRI